MSWRFAAAAALVAACSTDPVVFTEPVTFAGGVTVDPDTLNVGHQAYVAYCSPCHGLEGDGRGRASKNLFVPPRDFRIATFKFAATEDGKLPADEDLERIIKHGLDGTAMQSWRNLPDDVVHAIVQYIKTFSPEGSGFRHPRKKISEPLAVDTDPWGPDQREAAIARGKVVYHGLAQCYGCHPAYATLTEINQARAEYDQPPLAEMRPQAWLPMPRVSDSYTHAIPGDAVCEKSSDCEGTNVKCVLGRCEAKNVLLPPDFTVNHVRSGTEVENLYRIIARGITGTAMPAWHGALPDKDIWAIAYFVHDLTTWPVSRAMALKDTLKLNAR